MTDALLFEIVTERHPTAELRVIFVEADEEMNGTFTARAHLSCPADALYLADLEASMLGQPAALVLSPGNARRRLHGVVSAFRLLGSDSAGGASRARLQLEIVPRLALLRLRRQSRIFQDRTIREIVAIVLDEWKIKHSFQLVGTYKPRPYVTQHGETDYDFLRRILAVEGIGFFIASSPSSASLKEAPEVVFFDAATAYTPLAPHASLLPRANKAVFRHGHNFEENGDEVTGFTLHRKLAPKSAALGDFDFRRPQAGIQAVSHYGGPLEPSAIEKAERFEAFFYADRQEYESSGGYPEIDADRAQIALEQLRREVTVAHGRTRSARLLPGHVFSLDAHSVDALNQDYVVTRVHHEGHAPDIRGGEMARYEATFEAVPANVTFRPEIERGSRPVHGAETATVVGPKGEDVYTDVHGRVKVRFHWDHDSKGDEHSSCWLRVAEAWAGQRWGTQFVPRVGMEVLVTFLGGDVDRPYVTGCLYNTTHPTPFRLPGDAHRSGLRTQSSDGSGFNELSFQDLAGEEQVLVHARRDLDVTVGRDASKQVGGDEAHAVSGSLALTVEGAYAADVGGAHSMKVAGAATLAITGNQTVKVNGTRTETVSGSANLNIGGDLVAVVQGGAQPQIHGGAELKMSGDAVLRAGGHLVAVVGAHDARTSATIHVQGGAEIYSAAVTEIIAEEAIVLRVGESHIRISSDTIEIDSETIIFKARKEIIGTAEEKIRIISGKEALVRAEKKLVLQGEVGEVQLTREARIDGEVVKLNCAPDPVNDKVEHTEPKKPTTFELVDEAGKPMPGKRVQVVESDGTERSAVLDDKGQVKVLLDESGDVTFPDVGKVNAAKPA